MKHFVPLALLLIGCSAPVGQAPASSGSASGWPSPDTDPAPAPTPDPPTDPPPDPGPAPDDEPHADWLVQTWHYGTSANKTLLADGTGSVFSGDPYGYETYSADLTWSSDGTSFFIENDSPDVFGISENCRVLQLGDLMYTGERKASCPFDVVPLNYQEKALVGKWRFFDSGSDLLSLFGFELQSDRYGKGPDSFYSATVTVVGTWYLDGSTLSIASPVGDHTLQIKFQEPPGDWAKAVAVYNGQNHWGYIRTGYL